MPGQVLLWNLWSAPKNLCKNWCWRLALIKKIKVMNCTKPSIEYSTGYVRKVNPLVKISCGSDGGFVKNQSCYYVEGDLCSAEYSRPFPSSLSQAHYPTLMPDMTDNRNNAGVTMASALTGTMNPLVLALLHFMKCSSRMTWLRMTWLWLWTFPVWCRNSHSRPRRCVNQCL